jgi:thiopurine S-methyltransferase
MWKDDNTAFHQTEINPLLTQFLPKLNLPKSSRILVPLCGKSLDMNLLADSGHHVIGIELSSIAAKDYFEALNVQPSIERIGCFTRFRYRKTEIWCGDIFDLTAKDIHRHSVLYDCTSITAFPAERRPEYIRHFHQRLSIDSQIILLTTESANETAINSTLTIDDEVLSL